MKVERVFNINSNLKLEDIVNSLVDERIDNFIKKYYSDDEVNFATSSQF